MLTKQMFVARLLAMHLVQVNPVSPTVGTLYPYVHTRENE
jgi:hypothetical protein